MRALVSFTLQRKLRCNMDGDTVFKASVCLLDMLEILIVMNAACGGGGGG